MLSRHRTENSAGWRDGRTQSEEGEWVRERERDRDMRGSPKENPTMVSL